MFRFTAPPPLSLYVHFPWCVRKCPYCDFNSHTRRADMDESGYVDALLADLDRERPAIGQRPIVSIFFGGGTPSLFSPDALNRLLEGLRSHLTLAPDVEITLEANPGTTERGRFAEYRAIGINRLSLGIQSFDDEKLRALSRIHNAREARQAAEAARAAGFASLNLDLMFALPGQTVPAMLADLEQAIACDPQHLSLYQLTIEPNTAFAHHPPVLPDDDTAWAMQEAAGEKLAAADFGQYEISAWARPGHRCRHNRQYWTYGDYLGLGAGAHGKLSDATAGRVERHRKPRHPRDYLRAAHAKATPPFGERQRLSPGDVRFEFFLNVLRLTDGFDPALYPAHAGLPWPAQDPALRTALAEGWLEQTGNRLRPTERGLRFLNDVQALFLPDENEKREPHHGQ